MFFSAREQAERAAKQLREEGFDREISIVVKDNNREQEQNDTTMSNDSVVDGAGHGALGGFALGAGAWLSQVLVPCWLLVL